MTRSRKSKPRQLTMDIKLFLVRADGFAEIRVQACSAAAAKYQVFKKARAAGYFQEGFRQFLARGFVACELRQSVSHITISNSQKFAHG